jgi:hypothetical protein
VDNAKLEEILTNYANALKQLYDAAAENTLIVCAGLHGNVIQPSKLSKKKQDEASNWTFEDDLNLQRVVHSARCSLAAFAIKISQ